MDELTYKMIEQIHDTLHSEGMHGIDVQVDEAAKTLGAPCQFSSSHAAGRYSGPAGSCRESAGWLPGLAGVDGLLKVSGLDEVDVVMAAEEEPEQSTGASEAA